MIMMKRKHEQKNRPQKQPLFERFPNAEDREEYLSGAAAGRMAAKHEFKKTKGFCLKSPPYQLGYQESYDRVKANQEVNNPVCLKQKPKHKRRKRGAKWSLVSVTSESEQEKALESPTPLIDCKPCFAAQEELQSRFVQPQRLPSMSSDNSVGFFTTKDYQGKNDLEIKAVNNFEEETELLNILEELDFQMRAPTDSSELKSLTSDNSIEFFNADDYPEKNDLETNTGNFEEQEGLSETLREHDSQNRSQANSSNQTFSEMKRPLSSNLPTSSLPSKWEQSILLAPRSHSLFSSSIPESSSLEEKRLTDSEEYSF